MENPKKVIETDIIFIFGAARSAVRSRMQKAIKLFSSEEKIVRIHKSGS